MKNKTSLPKWFNGTIYEEGETVTNPFSGETYELNNLELSMYDFNSRLRDDTTKHGTKVTMLNNWQEGLELV